MKISKFKGVMAEQNVSGKKLAEHLGMTAKTFYSKMKNDKFGIDEAKAIKEFLHMSDQIFIEIFLT
jgi:DNA-binding Xre family transcriptional regulator